VGCEQAGAVPSLDGGAVDAEAVGDLVHGQQAPCAQPVSVARELMRAA
jgi:hypothetical protein